MKEPDFVSPQAPASPAYWMRAIATELARSGLSANVRETFSWLDLTASPGACQPASKEPEASLDADGYAEIRWWNDPSMPPADVAARISRVVAAARLPIPSETGGIQQ
jgi:hypothetical protein